MAKTAPKALELAHRKKVDHLLRSMRKSFSKGGDKAPPPLMSAMRRLAIWLMPEQGGGGGGGSTDGATEAQKKLDEAIDDLKDFLAQQQEAATTKPDTDGKDKSPSDSSTNAKPSSGPDRPPNKRLKKKESP